MLPVVELELSILYSYRLGCWWPKVIIICSRDWKPERVQLGRDNVTVAIFPFAHGRYLSLASNALSGPLPSAIPTLTGLTYVRVPARTLFRPQSVY